MKKVLKKQRENKKGFTLVEMIVVIAIIGVLAAMMVPALLGFVDRAHESNMNAAAAGLGRGIEAVLFEPKWSDLENDTYVATIKNKKIDEITHENEEATQNVNFSNEIKKISGDGYEDEGKIFITINKKTEAGSYPTLQNVVYGLSGAKDVDGKEISKSTAVSAKDIGIYGEPPAPATPQE